MGRMNAVGIRQGRLASAWEDEFAHAAACGFETIEWLFSAQGYETNPVWTDPGVDRIRELMDSTGVIVRSLCADYFISLPFFRVTDDARTRSISVLSTLIARSGQAGIRTIVLPALEGGEIRSPAECSQLLAALAPLLDIAGEQDVCLALETELPAAEGLRLVESAGHQALGICYDTGNAAAKGYELCREMQMLGRHVREVHIKDRRLHGPSVPLGRGATDLDGFFKTARVEKYSGAFILETPPGDDPLGMAAAHLAFVRERQ
jgi:L-ribulose-5-phosphate 3-epimerase